MLKKESIFTIIVIIFIITSLSYFRSVFIPGIFLLFKRLFLITIVLWSFLYLFNGRNILLTSFRIIAASVFFSIIVVDYTHQQSVLDTLQVLTPYAIFTFIFILIKFKPNPDVLENIIILLGVVYFILFFFQLLNYQTVYFGYVEEYSDYRFGITRVVFPGGGILMFITFYSLNKIRPKDIKWKWILIYLLCVIVILLQVVRQTIVVTGLISIAHFLYTFKFKNLGLISLIVVLFTLTIYYFMDPVLIDTYIDGVTIKTQQNFDNIRTYERVRALSFFLNDFAEYKFNILFGNGVPADFYSDFGGEILRLRDFGIDLSDVGLIGYYAMFGVFATISLLIIVIKGIVFSYPVKFNYLKYYFLFLLFTGITSNYLFHYYYISVNLIVIYMLYYLNYIDVPFREDIGQAL